MLLLHHALFAPGDLEGAGGLWFGWKQEASSLDGIPRRDSGGPDGAFNKEQAPLAILRYQPAVSRRLFRCLEAHLLGSPLTCKFVVGSPAIASAPGNTPPVAGASPSGSESR